MAETKAQPVRVEISKKLVLINSASSLATRVLSMSVLIWLQQYLLKRISPEEYSLLPVLYSVMMFAPIITAIFTAGLGRYIVEAYAKEDDERVTQIVSTMFPILCAAGFVFLAGGWTFAWYIDKVLIIAPERLWDARIMMAMLMFSAAVNLPLSAFGVGFFVRQKFVLQNLIGVGVEVFRLSLMFTLLFGVSTRVLWVVTASVCAGMLGQAINVIVSRRLVPMLRFRPSRIHWPIAKELTSFGGWQFVGKFANTIRLAIDPIILNRFSSAVQVSVFHVGTMPARHIVKLLMALRGPIVPSLIAMHTTGQDELIRKTYLRIGRMCVWAILLVTVPAMVYSRQLAILYVGESYVLAGTVLLVSLLSHPIGFANALAPEIFVARGNMRPWVLRGAILHGFNLAITIYLVCYLGMGALGSVLGTSIAECIGAPLLLWPVSFRVAGIEFGLFWREVLLPGFLPGLVVLVLHLMISNLIGPETWMALGITVACGGLLHVGLVGLALRTDDRHLLVSLFGRLSAR